MTKAITCTLIGRMIHEGWFHSMHDPAPAPLWRDPRGIHRLITLDHLVRMRSGLGFPVRHDDGSITLGFENSAVYQDAADAFEMAQRMIVATMPGAVFRYVNSGMNVLGAVIRDQIERRGLPYHQTVYAHARRSPGHEQLPALGRYRGQFHRLRCGIRDVARLCQTRRAVSERRRLERRTVAAQRLGRLRDHRDAYRHQLCRLFPHQHRRAASPRCRRKPHGRPERPTIGCSFCAGIG